MFSVDNNTVARQYFSPLNDERINCKARNCEYTKLSDGGLLKVLLLAKLKGWKDLRTIEKGIRAEPELQDIVGIDSFSASQLSRRKNRLDTDELARILGRLAAIYRRKTVYRKGVSTRIGKLSIIDATSVTLSQHARHWTGVRQDYTGVKLHVRMVAASTDSVMADCAFASTGNVSDVEVVNHFMDSDRDTTYVMDRGYAEKSKIAGWIARDVKFVIRVKKNFNVETIEELPVSDPRVIRDEIVSIKTCSYLVRLIEFHDDEGTLFRLLTNRYDLSQQEIMETYKNRWMIELFFKWMKQHLDLAEIKTQTARGIWNDLFISLIAYALLEIQRLESFPKLAARELLRTIKLYLFKKWNEMRLEIQRKPMFTTEGRKSNRGHPKPVPEFTEAYVIARPISY